jgi:phage gp36-like protein
VPAALPTTYCTAEDVEGLLSTEGVDARLDDDSSGAVDGSEDGRMTQAISYATAKVDQYAAGRYAASDLAASWVVNEWATSLACCWLCRRRGNPVPASIKELCDATIEDLKAVLAGTLPIADVGQRYTDQPAWSNVRVDPRYRVRQIRVERPISEQSPSQRPTKSRDFGADVIAPGEVV